MTAVATVAAWAIIAAALLILIPAAVADLHAAVERVQAVCDPDACPIPETDEDARGTAGWRFAMEHVLAALDPVERLRPMPDRVREYADDLVKGSADTPATSEEAWSVATEGEVGRAVLRILDGSTDE